MVVTTGAIRRPKLQSQWSLPTNQRPTSYRPDAFLSINQQHQSTERKVYHIPWICSPQTQPCHYFAEALPSLLSALWCQLPQTISHTKYQNNYLKKVNQSGQYVQRTWRDCSISW